MTNGRRVATDERTEDSGRFLGHERDCAAVLFPGFQRQARTLRRKFPHITIWWGTTVEVHSALNRLVQEGKLTTKSHTSALNIWQGLEAGARVVNPVDRVREIARGLPGGYGLRAMDSLQLAAALVWCQEKPHNRPFITADIDLSNAATQAGFSVTLVS